MNDNRVYKENILTAQSTGEYYLHDASGKTIGIYNTATTTWNWFAFGMDRLAKIDESGNSEMYTNDHLGNMRVAYNLNLNCGGGGHTYTINNASDYYAGGKILRSFAGSGLDKYGYQGSEREKEISDNDYYTLFRGLDVETMRWKIVDPKFNPSQSPYSTMDGNPVMKTDVLGDVAGGGDPIIPVIPRWEYKDIGTFIPYATHNLYAAFNNQVSNLISSATQTLSDAYKSNYGAIVARTENSLSNTYKSLTTVPSWSEFISTMQKGEMWENAFVGAASLYAGGNFLRAPLKSTWSNISYNASQNSLIGLNSKLFGAGASGYTKGILNSRAVRVGWGAEGNYWSFRGAVGHNPRFAAKFEIKPLSLFGNDIYKKSPSLFKIPKIGL